MYWRIIKERYASRIEFWIVLFFIIRLIGITNAPLEIAHNWRQVTGLMVARNFLEVDSAIFYPRIDDTQGGTGIIGMEFPLLNYLHFLLAVLFDYQHWYGRLINLLVSSFGVLYFYKTLKILFTERIAFYAAYLLLISSWFAFSRKMMPDTFCISLMLISLFYGFRYLQEGRLIQLICFFVFATLGMLSKIPALFYLACFIPYLVKEKPSYKMLGLFSSTIIFSLAIVWFWYFKWNPYLSDTYGQWYNEGMVFSDGFLEIYNHLGATFHRFYFDAFSGFIAFGLCILGFGLAVSRGERGLLAYVIVLSISFFFYMVKSGFYFHHHSYYILPFIPVMAILAGYAISLIPRHSWLIGLLLLTTIEGIANQQHDFFIKKSELPKLTVEDFIASEVPKNDLIAVNGNGNPQLLYLSHRKGWVCSDHQFKDETFLNVLKKQHCKFILLVKNEQIKKIPNLKKLKENDFFSLYML
jgi:hypothetical protein